MPERRLPQSGSPAVLSAKCFFRLEWPEVISTWLFFNRNNRAMYATNPLLALLSTAGALRRTFRHPWYSPAISSFLAPGWAQMSRDHPDSRFETNAGREIRAPYSTFFRYLSLDSISSTFSRSGSLRSSISRCALSMPLSWTSNWVRVRFRDSISS